MRHIRPHQLFTQVETESYQQRLMSVVLPHDRTPMLLETAVLISLIRLIRPERVFELGTYLGIQTLNLAANLGPGGEIYTLDLDREAFEGAVQLPRDREISRRHLAHQDRPAFAGTRYESRVRPLAGDSTTFDFGPYEGRIHLVYVDGGHDARTARSDTAAAFRMLAERHPAGICWHDYGNPAYPAVTELLDELAAERDLFHVEETRMCFYLRGLEVRW